MSNLAKLKSAFFDTSLIGTYLDKKTYTVLNRYGATVRKTAQFSMRKKKDKSPAGQPPHAHKNPLLRKLIFYTLDKADKSVVVGPVLKASSAKVMIPKIHEFGGTITGIIHGKTVTSKYPERSYIRPANEKTIGKVARWYK